MARKARLSYTTHHPQLMCLLQVDVGTLAMARDWVCSNMLSLIYNPHSLACPLELSSLLPLSPKCLSAAGTVQAAHCVASTVEQTEDRRKLQQMTVYRRNTRRHRNQQPMLPHNAPRSSFKLEHSSSMVPIMMCRPLEAI